MRPVVVVVFLRRVGAGEEVRLGCRTSSQVEAEEAVEGVGQVLLHPLLLCWERVGHEEQVGPLESESGWRVVVEEVTCCVWVYSGAWSARMEEEEGADHRGPKSAMVGVGGDRLHGQEGHEAEEGPGRLWTVPGWGAEVPSAHVEEGESGHLSRVQRGGAPVCLGEEEGNYLC